MDSLEIGRELGATTYLIYEYIKAFPQSTRKQIKQELELSRNSVKDGTLKLEDKDLVKVTKQANELVYEVVQWKKVITLC